MGKVQAYPRGIGDGTIFRGMSSSVGDEVTSPDTGAKCTLCEILEVSPLGSGAHVMVATDHPISRVFPAFFRESISRPTIMGRYL